MSQEQIDEMNEQLSRYEDSFGYGVRNETRGLNFFLGRDMVLITRRMIRVE